MPGAPNSPPKTAPVAPAPAVLEPPEKVALRRLVPMRVTLLLDLWKGAPHADLTGPLARAESFFAADFCAFAMMILLLTECVRNGSPRYYTAQGGMQDAARAEGWAGRGPVGPHAPSLT